MRKLLADLRRLYKRPIVIGCAIAIICHVVPPQYRAVCDFVANLCMGRI